MNRKNNTAKLSESGFCQLKLTGTAPRHRGAPKGNKNAAGQRRKIPSANSENIQVKSVEKITSEQKDKPQIAIDNAPVKEVSESELSSQNEAEFQSQSDTFDAQSIKDKMPSTATDQTVQFSPDLSPGSALNFENEKQINGENESCLLAQTPKSETDEWTNEKVIFVQDDFEEVFSNIDRLDDSKAAINNETNEADSERTNDDKMSSADSQIPTSSPLETQPSLFKV